MSAWGDLMLGEQLGASLQRMDDDLGSKGVFRYTPSSRVEGTIAVAVAPRLSSVATLGAASTDQVVNIGFHEQLQHAFGNRPQKIAVAALRGKLGARNLSSVIGASFRLHSLQISRIWWHPYVRSLV